MSGGNVGVEPCQQASRRFSLRSRQASSVAPKVDHQGPEPGPHQQLAHPPGRLRRIGLDGTQRAACNGGQVLSKPRELARGRLQGGDHVGAALYRAVLDALHQIVADQRAGVGFVFEPGPQLRRLDVGHVARSLCPGARRVVGAAPAMLVVEGVAQRVEGFLPTGNRLDSGG